MQEVWQWGVGLHVGKVQRAGATSDGQSVGCVWCT